MAEYQRPQAWRFEFGGVNLRDVPDAIAPNKYSAAQNVRSYQNQGITTRPGYDRIFQTGGNRITDVRAYATLETDSLPRLLTADVTGGVYLDTGVQVGQLGGNNASMNGASLVPFRPSQSPQAWMYIAGGNDYQKFSAPSGNNSVTAQKVGIAEPQNGLDAAPKAIQFTDFTSNASHWTAGGTGGSPADVTLVSDTAGNVFQDPVVSTRYTVQVNNTDAYLIGELVTFNGGAKVPIQDVIAPVATGSGLTIQAIRYDSGSSGACTIVPSPLPIDEPQTTGQIGGLRRGSLLALAGSEVVMVLEVIPGPNGAMSFRTSTSSTHSAGQSIAGVPAIVIDGVTPSAGETIVSVVIDGFITGSGTATFSQALATSPFASQLGSSGIMPGNDDYVHLLLNVGDPANVVTVSVIFNVGVSVDYTGETYSFSVDGTSLVNSDEANLTEISFQVSQLVRLGGNGSRTLANCNGVQIQVVTTASLALQFGSLWVGGGSNPDIGDDGVPYQYLAVPRSSLTGAQGNPTPAMRYGVNPRRQSVALNVVSASYDSQIDTWDYYRFGGSVTSYRYIGSSPVGVAFVDTFSDATATAGNPAVETNFEPWPSIDVPFRATTGGGATITAVGSFVTVSGSLAWPSTILSWLPGTLIQLSGQTSYTLRKRPTLISSNDYLFEVEESVGSASPSAFWVLEPNVARQILPYVWGPDVQGSFFGVGDPLRPGTVSYSQPYAPDSAPDANTIELCPPSEPLLGGALLRGVSLVSSSSRWWALYPAFSGTAAYNPLEQNVGRALIAPYGHVSDGQRIFFWAKDGIGWTDGGPFQSLTELDLFPLFPHEGVQGRNVVRNGVTFYAPDYSRAAQFRLGIANGYLFADYPDSTGSARTLVCRIDTKAWSQDAYADAITCHYGIEQQSGTLAPGAPALYPELILGSGDGSVQQEKVNMNDGPGATPIRVVLGTFEWDGGDARAAEQWGDLYLDCMPAAEVTALPVSGGAAAASATTVPAGASRTFSPISLGGEVLVNFLGLQISWTDDFTDQAVGTIVYLWQPSFIHKPEVTVDRYGDWDEAGTHSAKYYRGFVLRCDTGNSNKSLGFRSADDNTSRNINVFGNGEQELAYYFATPFVAHMLRFEPQDTVPWRQFSFQWIFDPWPELQQISSPWMDAGTPGAKYLLGLVVPMETGGNNASLTLKTSDGGNINLGTFSTTANVKTPVAIPISLSSNNNATPLVAHEMQIIPGNAVRIWWDEIRWDFDAWPELVKEASPWMNLGGPGAKYLLQLVIPADTGGNNATLKVLTADGNSVTLGPFLTTASVKTPVKFPFTTPLIGHELQIQPQNNCRLWFSEARWDYDPWPELSTAASKWMSLGTPRPKYITGLTLPIDSGGNNVSFSLLSSDGNNTTLGPVSSNASVKTPVDFALAAGTIAHEVQIIPGNDCRTWYEEAKWMFEEWPSLTTEPSPWMNLGQPGAKYLLGLVLPLDTGGVSVSIDIVSSDGDTVTVTANTTANVKTPVPFAFSVPLIGHEFQIRPLGPCRIWPAEARWDFDPWPEFTAEASPWFNMGTPKNKYLRGMTIPVDTGGGGVVFDLFSSDGAAIPLVADTAVSVKTPVPYAFTTPLIGHEWQIRPLGPMRHWFAEAKFDFEEWPELTAEAGAWTNLGAPSAKFMQGAIIPLDTNGQPVTLLVKYDGGFVTLGPVTTPAGAKTPIPFSFSPENATPSAPFVAHELQVIPQSPCRIWHEEIQWVWQATPELATFWSTQPTAHGMKGYQFISRIEAAYAASQAVTLTISVDDGTAPAAIALAATGSVKKRILITPTFNKGQLFQYSAVSAGAFQIYLEDWIVWVGEWGRGGAMTPYRLLGGSFGDKAAI